MSDTRADELEVELSIHAVLPVAPNAKVETEGYQHLHKQAVKVSRETILRHAVGIGAWHAAMTITMSAVGGQHSLEDNMATRASQLLRLSFITGAMLTSKTALETCLSGQYVQSLAMGRFLVESWIRIVYLENRPDMATNWYQHDDRAPTPVSNSSMLKQLRRQPVHRENAIAASTFIEETDKFSHPSPETMLSVFGASFEHGNLGTIYRPEIASRCIHIAATSCVLIAREVPNVISVDHNFLPALERVDKQMEEWERLNTPSTISEVETS